MLFRRNRRADGPDSAAAPGSEPEPASSTGQLAAIASLSSELVRAKDKHAVARILIDTCFSLLGVDLVAVALISEDGKRAQGLLAASADEDLDWWKDVSIDFDSEPSGIASAVFEGGPVVVYDIASSQEVNRRLAERSGAKSAVYVPLISEEKVPAVLVLATTMAPRVFTGDELSLLQALAAEAALALDRASSADALADALERERLVASIGRKVRSELDLDDVLRVAVEATGSATGVSRCYLRLGEPGGPMPLAAEWTAPGFAPIGAAADRLAVSNLAARDRKTVAVGDIHEELALTDPTLGGTETLQELDSRAVLATPVLVFEKMIGIFALHRPQPGPWSDAEISLAEAVARELGIAIHAAQLLHENAQRLEQQAALLKAAQVVTSELRLETVLQRLVDEVTKLLHADAADCYLFDSDNSLLRCAAVHGLDPKLVDFEFLAERSVDARFSEPVPNPAYQGFASAISAQMTWSGERRGVLGVATRDPERRFGELERSLLDDIRRPRVARGPQRGELRAERSPGAGPARVLRDRLRVVRAPLAVGDPRRGRPRGERGVRGILHRGADAGGARASSSRPRTGFPTSSQRRSATRFPASAEVLVTAAGERRLLAASSLDDDDRFGEEWRRLAGVRSLLAIPVDPPRREQGGLVVVFFAEQRDVQRRRSRARAPPGGSRARGPRAQRALRERAHRPRPLATARPHGQPPRNGARAGRDPRGARRPGTVAARRRRVRDRAGRRRRARRQRGRRRDRAPGDRRTALRRPPGPGATSSRRARRSSTRTPRATNGSSPTIRSSPRVTPPTWACRSSGWSEGSRECWPSTRSGPGSGARRKSRRSPRSPGTPPRCCRTPSSTSASRSSENGATRFCPTSPTGSSPSTARARSCSGTIRRRRSRAFPERPRSGGLRSRCSSASSRPGTKGTAGERLLSIQRGGDEVWLSLTEAVMHDPVGSVSGRIFAFRDVSSERIVEEMKSTFVSTVSHQLRAPLTSIYGFAETLLRRDVLFGEEERRTFLEYIASEAQRLTTIVDTLLSVARLEAGDMQVELAPTDLRAVVSDAISSVQEGAIVNGHRFVLELPDEPLAASADREKLGPDPQEPARQRGQVLAAAAERSRSRRIAGRAASRSGSSTRARAFPRPSASTSSRSSTARTARAATPVPGWGSSSRAGSCWRWAVGSGSTRPRAEGRASRSSCRSPRRLNRAQAGYRTPMGARVLVIDDEAPIRLLCRVNLEAAGMVVHEAEDGRGRRGGRAPRDTGRDPARRDDARHGRLGRLRRTARG